VKNTFKNYDLLADSLKYPNLTINVTTEYPFVWGNWFNKTLEEESGLDDSYYNVSVDDTAKTVSVEFYGKGDGVRLTLEKTVVEVEI
jgi:VCBS repeat-containing protein